MFVKFVTLTVSQHWFRLGSQKTSNFWNHCWPRSLMLYWVKNACTMIVCSWFYLKYVVPWELKPSWGGHKYSKNINEIDVKNNLILRILWHGIPRISYLSLLDVLQLVYVIENKQLDKPYSFLLMMLRQGSDFLALYQGNTLAKGRFSLPMGQ